ncbi:hypothetical protein D9758_018274 [Tetrapyrgos nigripes]|uniref:RNA helicase n=1 Tax=Tetrapyrgos nigripes TaxID=182062 RepID=A0A8H5BVB6_9AGAR|nr:hypothetical protein D9758_018274 [Tetrapyrgos nigripes]
MKLVTQGVNTATLKIESQATLKIPSSYPQATLKLPSSYSSHGNDRANVSLVVRAIHNPINSFIDLDFVIPKDTSSANDIPKTFIYYDNVIGGPDMEDHLIDILPGNLKTEGVVRLFSAAYSNDYRDTVMKEFKAGKVRVLICTDAAGMGCNIPDIDVVVQWKLPGSVSTFVQRAGRADVAKRTKAKKEITSAKTQAAARKAKDQYAQSCGVLRGACGGSSDAVVERRERKLDVESENEGLYTLVQTGICRRQVLARIFDQDLDQLSPTVPCCDLCDAGLLDKVRPGPSPLKSKRKAAIKKSGEPLLEVEIKLREWRSAIHRKDFKDDLFGPSGLLPNNLIRDLASVGPVTTLKRLEEVLGDHIVKTVSKRARADTVAETGKTSTATPSKKSRQVVPDAEASTNQTLIERAQPHHPVAVSNSNQYSHPNSHSQHLQKCAILKIPAAPRLSTFRSVVAQHFGSPKAPSFSLHAMSRWCRLLSQEPWLSSRATLRGYRNLVCCRHPSP